MIQTGDVITEVNGILSGGICWILSEFDNSNNDSLSEIAFNALKNGYCGPSALSNFAEDITGITDAKRAIILARELGLDIDLKDVEVYPFHILFVPLK